MDSDDDMDDDDDDDGDLLSMPMGSQKLELHIDQSFVAPSESTTPPGSPGHSLTRPNPSITMPPPAIVPKPVTMTDAVRNDNLFDQGDSLFGDDFMAQFGSVEDEEFEQNQNKKPLFPRRIPLLESSLDEERTAGQGSYDRHDDLGLERLSISQSHRTKSGAALPIETVQPRPTHVATSGTTIVSAALSRFNVPSRLSMGAGSLMSQESSQLEEELLEMSARQHGALLDDMIMDDEQMMDEEAELHDLMAMQYEEQERQMREQNDTGNKRKQDLQQQESASSTPPAFTSVEDVDLFLEDSYAVGSNSLSKTIEASKKSRLESTSASREKTSSIGQPANRARRPLVPDEPKHDYTLPPETGSFIHAKTSSGKTLYLAKRVRVDHTKVGLIICIVTITTTRWLAYTLN